jgi:hypothetical protein
VKKKTKILGVCVILISVYTMGWYYGAGKIQEAISHYQQECSQHQQSFTYSSLAVTGFPGVYRVLVKDIVFKGPICDLGIQAGGDLIVDVRIPEVKAKAKSWRCREFYITTKGKSGLEWSFGPEYQNACLFDKVTAKISLNRRRHVSSVIFKMKKIEHQRMNPFTVDEFIVHFKRGTQVQQSEKKPVWVAAAEITNLLVPGSVWANKAPGLVINFNSMVLETRYIGSLWRVLKNWRDGGGIIEVKDFSIAHPDFKVSIQGTLALDEELRLLASVQSNIIGYSELLKLFVKNQMISKSEATAAQIAFTMLEKTEAGHTVPTDSLHLPITAQDGRLSIGPLVLAPLPSLISLWPQGGNGKTYTASARSSVG